MKRPLKILYCVAAFLICAPAWAETREYALILEDPPISRTISSREELGGKAALEAGARIEQAQQVLRRELAARGVRVAGSVQTVLNAVFVTVDDERQLQGLPGVRRAAPTRRFRHHLNAALPLVNAAQGWTALAAAGFSNAGAGVKIGIIDTGIDQNHPGFQDASLAMPVGFPKCLPADCAYTNNKVIVARSYVSLFAGGSGASNSRPDDTSPRDRKGLGTAAAMVAAGVQNTGPLGTISGVAPKAYLGNYKIFGSPGVNDGTTGFALSKALDDAYKDGMDIVTVDLGLSAWYAWQDSGAACGDPICDYEAQAVENAVAHNGMVVVVSAGNDAATGIQSPGLSSINTPGTAPSAITVGASRNGHVLTSRVGLTAADAPGNLRGVTAAFGDSLRTKTTAPLRDVGGDGFACSALAAGALNGAIALVQRSADLCDYRTKVMNALNAGAVGVLLYREDGADTPMPPLGLGGLSVPAAGIGNTDGRAFKTYLQTHPDAPVTLDPAWIVSDDASKDTVAFYSSRGPSIGDFLIKPELVAPGTAIYTATEKYDANGDLYDASGYAVADGTSFAAPLVAGAVALVKQKNPNFTPAQLKSAVVNTASANVLDGGAPASVAAVGAGKLNVEAAVRTNVTVDPATLAFGLASTSIGGSRQLTVYNQSASDLTLAIARTTPDSNGLLRLSTATVPAGQTGTVVVYFEGRMPLAGAYEGAITIRGGAVDLRVPFSYLVGDGVPYNLLPVDGMNFLGQVGQSDPLYVGLRALDRYGVPVGNIPVSWRGTKGGAYIDPNPAGGADTQTYKYGAAFAGFFPGAAAGAKEITATVGSGAPLTLAFGGWARVQPVISVGGVINAASGQAAQAGQGLAPGSYISIWGQNLSDVSLPWNSMLAAGVPPYLPIVLGGVSVSFDVPSAGLSLPGRLTWAGTNQINVQIPWELTGRSSALMKVSAGPIASAVYTLYLADRAPGVFENPIGSGLAAAVDALTGALITSSNPMRKGRWVSIYVNGLGPVDPNARPATGEMTRPPEQGLVLCVDTPVVTIGGTTASVNFAGLTPTGIGYYQINALVPADAPSGTQPVTITIKGVAAKAVNLPIQ